MRRRAPGILLSAALAVPVLAGCHSGSVSNAPATSAPTTVAQVDPYEAYVKQAPKGEPILSREDAQTRAFLGCNLHFAPGTVDAVLHEAYKAICDSSHG